MKKTNRIFTVLLSITAVAGIGCIIAAFVLGADPRQIKNQVIGNTSHKLQTQELDIKADQIRKLNIDVGSGDVKIQNGDQDKLLIKKKGSWEPVTLKSNGEIKIEQKSRHFQLFWFQTTDEITVILPKGVTFDEVSMDCGSGDIESDSLNITGELSIDCGSGDVNLSTITAQTVDFDLGSGDVTLTMTGREKDYNYDLDLGSGDVKIGDTSYEDDFKKRNDNASKWINIDCGSGDLTIDFDNETL